MTKVINYTCDRLANSNYKIHNHQKHNCKNAYKKWDISKIMFSFHYFLVLIVSTFYKNTRNKFEICNKSFDVYSNCQNNKYNFNSDIITEDMKMQEVDIYYNSVIFNQPIETKQLDEFHVDVFYTEAFKLKEKNTINYINKHRELSNISQTIEDTFNNLCIPNGNEVEITNDDYNELSSFSKSEWRTLKENHVTYKIFSNRITDIYRILENDDWIVSITPKK